MPAYGAGPYLPAIVLERPVYVREMNDGLYTPFTYLLYKVLLNPKYEIIFLNSQIYRAVQGASETKV